MSGDGLTIRGLKLRSVVVPMARPLVTRVVTIEKAAFLLIDLETEEGVTGRSYLFGYSAPGNACLTPPLRWLSDLMKGQTIEPETLFDKALKGLTLMGHQGIAMMAVSGFDMACWDAFAQAQGKPLAEVLGGEIEPIKAYNSNGLGLIEAKAAAEEAKELIAEGNFEAVKVRLGRETLSRAPREIIQYLFEHDKALDVADSITARGFFPNEPLLAVKENNRTIVIEGNRRLAALKALREPGLLEGSLERKVERLSRRIIDLQSIATVPVTIAPNRRATDRQIVGRHIGSPVLAWRLRIEQASFSKNLRKDTKTTSLGISWDSHWPTFKKPGRREPSPRWHAH